MAIPIPTSLIEFILFGPDDDRRQLQDSPILGDVWVEFGKKPEQAVDLLISPFRTIHAGTVAAEINDALGTSNDQANIAYLQGLVIAHLSFQEVLCTVVPISKWWSDKRIHPDSSKQTATARKHQGGALAAAGPVFTHEIEKRYYAAENSNRLLKVVQDTLGAALQWYQKVGTRSTRDVVPLDRFATLAGLILWAGTHIRPSGQAEPATTNDQITYILKHATKHAEDIVKLLDAVAKIMLTHKAVKPSVWQISLNRAALPALTKSVPAVKADAAKTLFQVDCSDIGWAVIDSGIAGNHPAFLDKAGKSRVQRSFDFQSFRRIVSLSNAKDHIRATNLRELMKNKALLNPPRTLAEGDEDLRRLADDARSRGPIRWELVEKFVEIRPDTAPPTNHGTHVAGIIGASKTMPTKKFGKDSEDFADGMCPDISLYDFRVLGPDMKEMEFAIVAAMQFIRYLNDRDNFFTIHGANLSLSIPHDVRNFACGHTPICNECERLVESGVVLVAAAGNHGYKNYETKEGEYGSYAAFSITDPGNADCVITVGSTHRYSPYTYGVSFFSSRGPTGDGRLKPDLVAPGERIHAPLSVGSTKWGEWGDLDGTSMAAPHVSGAAAMLMARYSELTGQPRRIKHVLCASATDLGRERSFQGHGMLDVLRAFQSI
jgi:hypothetical protein